MASMFHVALGIAASGLLVALGGEVVAGRLNPFGAVGHWILDVYFPDGSPASHTEFEKALDWTGPTVLGAILAGMDPSGFWEISLRGGKSSCVREMTVTALETEDPDQLELAGCFRTASPPAGLSIERVQTIVPLFSSGRPDEPRAVARRILMDHTLLEPIAVAPGQAVQVKVVIRLSRPE